MNPRRLWLVVMSLGLVAPAIGQVDNRVQPLQPLQGQVLDANNQVGSGGFNTPRSDFLVSPNAVLYGNVTGLGGFRESVSGGLGLTGPSGLGLNGAVNPFNVTGLRPLGSTLLQDPNSFRADLPSSDISYFNRRSVSVQDLQNGSPYRPNYYYGPSQTIVDVGGMQRGLNVPGSSTVASTSTPLPSSGFGLTRPESTLPSGIGDPLDLREQPNVGLGQPVPSLVQTPRTTWGAPSNVGDSSAYSPAMSSSLFGPSPTQNYALRPYSSLAGQRDRPDGARPAPPPTETVTTDDLEADVDEAGLAPGGLSGLGTVPPQGATAQAGVDVFSDMALAIQQAAALDPNYRLYLSGGIPLGDPAAPAENRLDAAARQQAEAAQTPSGRVIDPERARFSERLTQAARWAKQVLDQPIKSFAGTGDTPVNRYLREAERLMKAGDFYAAGSYFEAAAVTDPDNPLPLLGRGHANAAAGDYMSAVHSIERGIARFPDLTAFRLDLISLIGGRDVFDRRRADLEKQLLKVSQEQAYQLRFLLGYLEYYSGLRESGVTNLKSAAAAAPASSVIRAVPKLLGIE